MSQIEEALRSRALEHFVLVVRPAALESANMRREKRVLPGPSLETDPGPLAKPHNRHPDMISLVFDGIATTRRVGAISGSSARSPMHSDRHDPPNFKFVDVIGADGMSLPIS